MAFHKYYEQNKTAILADLDLHDDEFVLKKWGMSKPGWLGMRASWRPDKYKAPEKKKHPGKLPNKPRAKATKGEGAANLTASEALMKKARIEVELAYLKGVARLLYYISDQGRLTRL